MSRGPDATTLFERALSAGARGAGCPVAIVASTSVRWASATFTGARHGVTIDAPASDALAQWLAALPEAEFCLPGHLVADLVIVGSETDAGVCRATIEALTVEER